MSTRNTDELEATPAWGDSKEFVSVSADGMSINGKKNTRPTARAGRVPSDLSLGWLLIMITKDDQHVNR